MACHGRGNHGSDKSQVDGNKPTKENSTNEPNGQLN